MELDKTIDKIKKEKSKKTPEEIAEYERLRRSQEIRKTKRAIRDLSANRRALNDDLKTIYPLQNFDNENYSRNLNAFLAESDKERRNGNFNLSYSILKFVGDYLKDDLHHKMLKSDERKRFLKATTKRLGKLREDYNPNSEERLNLKELESYQEKLNHEIYRSKNNGYSLEYKLTAGIAISGIIGGIIFMIPKFTGNAISNIPLSTSSSLGVILLILGILAGVFWAKKK